MVKFFTMLNSPLYVRYLCNDVLGVAGGWGLEDGVGLVGRHIVHTHKEHLFHTLPVSSVVL